MASSFSSFKPCIGLTTGHRQKSGRVSVHPCKKVQRIVSELKNDETKDVIVSRRGAMSTVGMPLLGMIAVSWANPAAAGGFNSYVKKKKLDPLDSYVAPVLAAKDELVRSGRVAVTDVDEARSMLRSGALSGMRANVRAIGEYATELGTTSDASKLVTGVIQSLEKYDLALMQIQRGQKPVGDPQELLTGSLDAVDSLLKSVPEDVMQEFSAE